ncbi:hypothetical protein RFI_27986 [Reticulomyxa filosa]|uniref:Uncharacterized protein n=1 Tax=Reticulomyxa filosa TaxID=46433 RepID=X6M8R1_RETFI|nr:hypothetical protein RFI_27986 [Reticulomyxa filosa]|eukprot:ETO09390.1 hypothetical protein RFI_27986 [Reticulomyxa filosa]
MILAQVGSKLTASLREKSELIEAVNNDTLMPQQFKENNLRRKLSVQYQESVAQVKKVPLGRMRLPTIVSKKGLPMLPPGNKSQKGVFGRSVMQNSAIAAHGAYHPQPFKSTANTDSSLSYQQQKQAAQEAAKAVNMGLIS